MGFIELFLIALGLSMDAFAVSICKGLSMKKATLGKAGIVGAYFGIFQAVMPLIGYFIGIQFEQQIKSIDHWIAFVLLGVIGVNMIRGALKDDDIEVVSPKAPDTDLSFKTMIVLAVATSIDALAVGVTFAFLSTSILPAVSVIGITTFLLSVIGVKIGSVFGSKFKTKAEVFGGVILVAIGLKILLEHLEIINF